MELRMIILCVFTGLIFAYIFFLMWLFVVKYDPNGYRTSKKHEKKKKKKVRLLEAPPHA